MPGRGFVDVARNRGRADETHGRNIRMCEKRVNCFLVALHDVEDPAGRPASSSHFAKIREADGSRSDGLRMKVLPQASATGNIHIGTMAGKLNDVMPATTPNACRSELLSTRVPTFSVISPFKSCGAFVRDGTGEFVNPLFQNAQEAVENLRSPERRRRGPGREGAAGGSYSSSHVLRRSQAERPGLLASCRIEHRRSPAAPALHRFAIDKV